MFMRKKEDEISFAFFNTLKLKRVYNSLKELCEFMSFFNRLMHKVPKWSDTL